MTFFRKASLLAYGGGTTVTDIGRLAVGRPTKQAAARLVSVRKLVCRAVASSQRETGGLVVEACSAEAEPVDVWTGRGRWRAERVERKGAQWGNGKAGIRPFHRKLRFYQPSDKRLAGSSRGCFSPTHRCPILPR